MPTLGDPLQLTFDGLWARLQVHAVHGALVDGNPIKPKDPLSPLRSMQAQED